MSSVGGPRIVKDGLVLYLDVINKRSGSNLINLISGEEAGTFFNGASFNDSAILMDGVDDYYTINNMNQYQLFNTNQVTIGVWFKFSTFSGTGRRYIFENRAGSNNNPFPIFVDRINNNSGLLKIYTGIDQVVNTIYANEVYYVSYSVDVNFNQDNINVYINSELNGVFSVNYTGSVNTSENMYLGRAYPISGYRFIGEIYNFHFYNRILTSDEVLQNFNSFKGRFVL